MSLCQCSTALQPTCSYPGTPAYLLISQQRLLTDCFMQHLSIFVYLSDRATCSLFKDSSGSCIVRRDSSVGIATRYELDGRSLSGIVGSNPTGGMDVCVVFVV